MKSIFEIACDSLVKEKGLPKCQHGGDIVLGADWNGTPRLYVHEGTSDIENSQLSSLYQTTPITVRCLAADRRQAVQICDFAADVIYRAFESLERTKGSGILSIVREQAGIGIVPERKEHDVFRTFSIIHKFNR